VARKYTYTKNKMYFSMITGNYDIVYDWCGIVDMIFSLQTSISVYLFALIPVILLELHVFLPNNQLCTSGCSNVG
jgi:hypothetical protein